jgi:hypothetical protein
MSTTTRVAKVEEVVGQHVAKLRSVIYKKGPNEFVKPSQLSPAMINSSRLTPFDETQCLIASHNKLYSFALRYDGDGDGDDDDKVDTKEIQSNDDLIEVEGTKIPNPVQLSSVSYQEMARQPATKSEIQNLVLQHDVDFNQARVASIDAYGNTWITSVKLNHDGSRLESTGVDSVLQPNDVNKHHSGWHGVAFHPHQYSQV